MEEPRTIESQDPAEPQAQLPPPPGPEPAPGLEPEELAGPALQPFPEPAVEEPSAGWIMPLVGALIVIGVIVGSIYSAYQRPGGSVRGPTGAPAVGKPAVDFQLRDLAGKQLTLSEHKGRPVVINMWATWCVYCVEEMPMIQAAYRKYQSKGLQVLAVDVDRTEDIRDVTSFVKKVGITFPVLLNGDEVAAAYQVQPLPTSFFIDRQGVIRDMALGMVDGPMLEDKLKKIL